MPASVKAKHIEMRDGLRLLHSTIAGWIDELSLNIQIKHDLNPLHYILANSKHLLMCCNNLLKGAKNFRSFKAFLT